MFTHLRVLLLMLLLVAGCSTESKKARHLERANRYFQAGEIDKAEIEYASVLRLDEANVAAVRQLGLIYFDQGKPAKAYPLLKQAEALAPDDLEIRLKLASLYLAGRKFKEVRTEAEYVLQKQPGHDEALVFLADAAREPDEIQAVQQSLEKQRAQLENRPGFHLALGSLAYRQKKRAEAEVFFKEAVRLGPDLPIAHSMLGNLYAAQEKTAAAESAYKVAFDLSPVRSSRRFDYIDLKVRNGEPAIAKKLLEDIVQKAPDNLPALNRLTELTLAERKYGETSALLRKVFTRDPQNFEAMLTQGLLHLAQADTPKAITHFERMNGLFPTVPKVRYHLALAFLGTNNITEAVGHLNQAIRQDPEYTDAIVLLAEINTRKGDSSTAIALLSDLIRKRPSHPEAHLLLASSYRMRNNLEEALAVYTRLAEMYPKNAQVPLLMGGVLLQQNQTNQARLAFDKALQLAPDYLPALEQLITLDLLQRQFAVALGRIQKQLERNPTRPEPYILLAKAYYEQGQTNNVEKELLRALELDPTQREPYVLLARLYVQRKEHPQAIERLKRVIARDPRDVAALMLLGMIHNQLKDFTAAREMYEHVLAVNPRFSPALNNLAYLYSEQLNQLERAFQMAQRARTLLPWDGFTADTLGWILFKREEYAWALSLLQESADRLPDQPEVLYHLGMGQYMMGFEAAARISLERSLQLNKDFPGRDLCVRRLAILAIDVTKGDKKTLAALEQQLAADKDDPVALAKLAAAYEGAGMLDKARAACERAMAINPNNVSVMLRLARLHNGPKAMELARRARTLAPDDPTIAHTLGRIALDSTEPSEQQWAHSLLQESARKLPDDPQVTYDLAWSHFSLGRLIDAETALRTALKSQRSLPAPEEARRFLGFLTAEAGDADIKAAVERDTAYMPARLAAARMHERQNQPALAQSGYEAILKRYPLFTPAHKALAKIYHLQGDLGKALAHANDAREQAPNDTEIAAVLGIISFKRGNYARSAQLLAESARQPGADAEVFYYLGMAHYRLKRLAESKEALQQAVTLNVAPSLAEEANRVLAELN
jgi:tetratricopeptide (TPR) repeat protein